MKSLMIFIGNVASITGFMTMFTVFMGVYFGKWNSVDINSYGEANFEFILLLVLLPIVIYTYYCNVFNLNWRKLIKNGNEEGK